MSIWFPEGGGGDPGVSRLLTIARDILILLWLLEVSSLTCQKRPKKFGTRVYYLN